LTCESLLVYIEHNGDVSPKEYWLWWWWW